MRTLGIYVLLGALALTAYAQSDSMQFQNTVTIQVIRNGKVISEAHTHNLKTLAGAAFLAGQMSGTGTATNVKYISVSNDATAPAITDTVMAGELTTNGFSRAAANYTFGGSCSAYPCTYTLDFTWTASAGVSNIQKAGAFTASSGGTMFLETAFTPQTLNNGDQLKLVWSINQAN